MDKVFVDTNIILDWLGERKPHFKWAKELFSKGEEKEVEILVSTISFINTQYILRKQIGKEKAKQTLAAMRTICTVCSSGEKEIDLALLSSFTDFEDAFQYFSALNNSAKVIITRNPKDFKYSSVPIMNAEEYLKSMQ